MSNKFLSGQGSGDIIQFLKDNVIDARAAIQLVPNGTIQSYDATLQSLANLSTTSNKLIKSTGTDQFTTISISTHGENALVSSEALLTSSQLPTTVSSFQNDSEYITISDVSQNLSEYNNDIGFITILDL